MLIEVHYGDGSILLVNGNCRVNGIHLLDYIRKRCCLSSTMKIDLCLLTNGEPLCISTMDSKYLSTDKRRFPSHIRCVLTKIDEEGKYVPLSNDSTLITSDFLAKLKRATSSSKASSPRLNPKSIKQSNQLRRPRSLRSLVIVATLIKKTDH